MGKNTAGVSDNKQLRGGVANKDQGNLWVEDADKESEQTKFKQLRDKALANVKN